ncbi:MAG: amino acid ABC transporter substrate-binding protein [Alphaproteobacteria bacterium]|nr:MAG: amino acid ABC transporter substrate-binding protein [Alphaproteobacteria bacterium]
MKPILKGILAGAAALIATAGIASAQTKTLDTVKSRGSLSCGVNVGLAGFSQPDDKGNWTGLDVDYCKAIAAAVLGDATKVKYVPTTAKERFTALQSGEIDVLIRNTTWTTARDSSLGLIFAGVNYYDGQGFMVKGSLGVKTAKELNGATVCVQTGTTTELNLADYFKANKMTYKPVVFEKLDETLQAYLAGRCDVYTTDQSGLYSVRVQQPKPEDHLVLPEIISKEPLGPSVRQGDDQWLTVVKWVHYALLNAEEAGITQANVAEMVNSTNPEIKRIVGKDGELGKGLGLPNDFVVSIVKAVGNYGELFERNVGSGSRLKIARGLNKLWNNGGLQYAPPLR